MAFFTLSDRTSIYYEDRGTGRPVVMMHGWTSSHADWRFAGDVLVNNGYRVIAMDHRGHGASGRPAYGYTINRLASDAEELMMYLGLSNVTLVGHSMGAHMLFEYCKKFGCGRLAQAVVMDMTPKLVCDETWPYGLYHGQLPMQAALDSLAEIEEDPDAYFPPFMLKTVLPATLAMMPRPAPMTFKNDTHMLMALMMEMIRKDYRETVSCITVPTVIMFADPGTLYGRGDAEFLQSKIPNARLCPFENTSHVFPLEVPQKFAAELLSFVKEA